MREMGHANTRIPTGQENCDAVCEVVSLSECLWLPRPRRGLNLQEGVSS